MAEYEEDGAAEMRSCNTYQHGPQDLWEDFYVFLFLRFLGETLYNNSKNNGGMS